MKKVHIKNITIGEGKPKICVPLMGKTDEELLNGAEDILAVAKEYDISIVEFRGDYYGQLNNESALMSIMRKLQAKFEELIFLFTIRSNKEGGEKLAFEIPTVNDINAFVVENKLADMVDVELFSGEEECKKLISLAQKHNVKIIMSNHDFKTTPPIEEMVNRLKTMQEYGADIAKIAVMPENFEQVTNLLEATDIMKKNNSSTPVVSISMGKEGTLTRVTGEIFGSAITFATLGEASAPGQIHVKDVRDVLDTINSALAPMV